MTSTSENLNSTQDELKWITIREKDSLGPWEKTKSKFLENPFVPIGCCLVTTGILVRGMTYLLKRDKVMQQRYMRYRVLSQGLTVLAMYVGIMLYKNN